MKKSRSVMTVPTEGSAKDYLECQLSKSYSASSNTLGIDLWRGRRCCSGNLLLPPLSQRQSEKARTPDNISRPTTLPLLTLPSIAITTYQDSAGPIGLQDPHLFALSLPSSFSEATSQFITDPDTD